MSEKEDKKKNPIYRTPADMHGDGVHFNKKIKEALDSEKNRTKQKLKSDRSASMTGDHKPED